MFQLLWRNLTYRLQEWRAAPIDAGNILQRVKHMVAVGSYRYERMRLDS